VEAEGRSLVYSGDTDLSDSLVELAGGLTSWCWRPPIPSRSRGTSPPGSRMPGGPSGVGRVLLNHFYPPCDAVDVVALAAQEFSGEVLRAEDGLRLAV